MKNHSMIFAVLSIAGAVLGGCASITGDSTKATAGMGSYSYERTNPSTGEIMRATATSGRDVTGVKINITEDGGMQVEIERLDGAAAQARTLELSNILIERLIPLLPPGPVAMPRPRELWRPAAGEGM